MGGALAVRPAGPPAVRRRIGLAIRNISQATRGWQEPADGLWKAALRNANGRRRSEGPISVA